MSLKYLDIYVNASGVVTSTDLDDAPIVQYSNNYVVRVLAIENYFATVALNILLPNGVTLSQKQAILQPEKFGDYFAWEYKLSQLDTSVAGSGSPQMVFTVYTNTNGNIAVSSPVSIGIVQSINSEVLVGDPTSLSNIAENLNDFSTQLGALQEDFDNIIELGGLEGPAGAAATIAVGGTTTSNPGTNASVVNSGTTSAAVLNFTIPRGDVGAQGPTGPTGPQGPVGATPNLSIGTVLTGVPGSSAQVSISGTSASPIINFTIPRGNTGAAGADGQEVEFRTNAGFIEWRYVGSATWFQLIALSVLQGPAGATGAAGADGTEIELGTGGGFIRWRYVGDENYTNLVSLASLTGPQGPAGSAATIAVGTVTTGAPGTNVSITNAGTSSAAVFNFTIPRGQQGEGFVIDEIYPTVAALLADTITVGHFGLVSTASETDPDNGKLYLYTSEGWQFATDISVQGIQGPQGETGLQGPAGAAGTNGIDGEDGREVEIRNSGTFIQWRYVGETTWNDIVSLADLTGDDGAAGADGKQVEFQKTSTHIQWRYVGDASWNNLVALTDITGPAGSDATVTKSAVEAVLTGTITSHDHNSTYYTESEVDTFLAGKAATIHTHVMADITNLDFPVDTVNGKTGTVVLNAGDIAYNNSASDLISTSTQGAIDELDFKKVNVSALASNVTLYATTAASNITNYNKLVTTVTDPSYDSVAQNIATGTITGTNQLVGQLVSEPGVLVGNPGVITIFTVGNIRKVAGNSNTFAEFFYRLYKRDSLGLEQLLAQSDTTGAVNPTTSDYREFNASALLNNGTFTSTDRIVIKYFANNLAGGASAYEFQFGGANPVRTLLPVPVSVVVQEQDASTVLTSTTNFNGLLSGNENTVQKALDKLDDVTLSTLGGLSSSDSRIANWDTAYGWGNHASEGYLKSFTETDPIFSAHTTKNISNGTGFLKNNGSGTWTYDNSTYQAAGDYATLVGGKIPTDQLPALAITESHVVTSEAQMLALVAQKGDVAIRTDVNKTFILLQEPASNIGNWQELLSPGTVTSVNGQTGVVTLGFADVGALSATDSRIATWDAGGSHGSITDGSNPHNTTFANIASKPTDIAGYGITDAYTKTQLDAGQLDNRYYTETEVDTKVNNVVKVQEVTIAVADWVDNQVIKTVTGVTATNIIWLNPTIPSYNEYLASRIIAIEQGTDSLTFVCTTVPTNDIIISVVIGE